MKWLVRWSSLMLLALTLVVPAPAVVVLSAVIVLAPSTVTAADIIIDDTNPNDTTTITVNDFEGGFSVNGVLIQQGLGDPQSTTVGESLVFTGIWLNPSGGSGSRTLFFVEDGTTQVSDIFSYTFTSAGLFSTITGSFQSDTEGGSLGLLPDGVNPADVVGGSEVFPFQGIAPFLTATVTSDSGPEPVPEPTSLALLGLGGLGLAGYAWRRRKQAV